MPQQLPQPTALRWRDHWPPLLVLLACLLAMGGIAKLAFERDRAELQAQVQTELRALRLRLGAMAESSFDVTSSLETLIQVQGDLDAKAFDAAAMHLLRDQPQLRNVVAAPGDVVRHVHPFKGNEAVLGLDYRSVPLQWAQVERARALRAPIVFAPVRLVQGGKAVVQRRPVFLSAPGQPDRYWGTLAAVANLDPFIARAGLGETKLRLALYERLQDGRPGERIWGDAELLAQRHAREELRLTGATWTLIGAPAQGWGWVWRGSDPWLWIGSLVSGLIVAMSVVLTRRRLLLAQRSVALEAEVLGHQQSQRELQAATARLRALLQISSDWYWEQDAEFHTVEISGFEGMARTEGMQLSLGRCRWEHPWVDPEVPGEAAWAAHRQACERHEPFRDFEYAARPARRPAQLGAHFGRPLLRRRGPLQRLPRHQP
jgi:sensor domain CHASE-containing protein